RRRSVPQYLQIQPRVTMVPHKVQYRQNLTIRTQSQSATKLLNENRSRVRGTKEKQGVDARNINSLIQEVSHKKPLERMLGVLQICVRFLAFFQRVFSRQIGRAKSSFIELLT